MNKLLIFGGTTEGRELMRRCAENSIPADVSVTTDYGARLLGESNNINVFTGKLDSSEMLVLIRSGGYTAVIDATHPYAAEATENIRSACAAAGKPYLRLVREKSTLSGTVADTLTQAVELINKSGKTVLSTLGTKELPFLTGINDYKNRVWLRVLPGEGVKEYCESCGFDPGKVITGKGPFTAEENKEHIRISGARILLTKDSGKAGGYPEKLAAAKECGIETITLARPAEDGYTLDALAEIITDMFR